MGEIEELKRALEFYADPDTYFAIGFLFDPPCGDFRHDFSSDHGGKLYDRPMPGQLARKVLRKIENDKHTNRELR